MLVMGFMSGTSLDGVDVALIETDGQRVDDLGPCEMTAFSAAERTILERATSDSLIWNGDGDRPGTWAEAANVIEQAHVRAGRRLNASTGRKPDLIGFHGQTMLHRPERQLSVQIGDPQIIADELGVPVVAQMRQADLRAGGQGAPLVPAYHAALADRLGLDKPLAFLNIGGVANLTWIGDDGSLIAFDTGPGNGLIDQVVQARGAGRYDDGGRLAAAGTVDGAVLRRLLLHPHFQGQGPRSLDRYDFPLDWAEAASLQDAAATLTEFTACAVALSARQLPKAPKVWIVCGGGAHNPTMMSSLSKRLGDCRRAEDLHLRGDFIEAEAMAFLAARSHRTLPLTFPATTGVPRPLTGGETWHPRLV